MSTPSEPSESPEPIPPYLTPSTYLLDANDEAEMARLLIQDQFFMQYTGGLFPEGLDLSPIRDVLDIACGSGGWANHVARAYPEKKVMGIDLSIRMIMYARTQALVYELPNARYRLMDALKPLDFPDASFDLVNARFLFAFMPPAAWPNLLRECYRVLRPDGIIRLTEGEYGTSNSIAYEQMGALNTRLLKAFGLSFSPDGRHIGIVPMLCPLLRQAGFPHVQHRALAIDYSSDSDAHDIMYQNHRVSFELARPFLLKYGVTTPEEFDTLSRQALDEMRSDDFYALQFFLTAWGRKV
jgi:ubiquinone/menaquinone biosynthesis C-methylase UbiE